MWAFFKGWRRKIGCVLLVMALLLMCCWMRSRFLVDTYSYVPDEGPRHRFTLSPYGIQWARTQGVGQSFEGWDTVNEEEFGEPVEGWDVVWNWKCGGFQFGVFQLRSVNNQLVYSETSLWIIPYWSLILPPTLLSAYLILWKPRPKSPQVPFANTAER